MNKKIILLFCIATLIGSTASDVFSGKKKKREKTPKQAKSWQKRKGKWSPAKNTSSATNGTTSSANETRKVKNKRKKASKSEDRKIPPLPDKPILADKTEKRELEQQQQVDLNATPEDWKDLVPDIDVTALDNKAIFEKQDDNTQPPEISNGGPVDDTPTVLNSSEALSENEEEALSSSSPTQNDDIVTTKMPNANGKTCKTTTTIEKMTGDQSNTNPSTSQEQEKHIVGPTTETTSAQQTDASLNQEVLNDPDKTNANDSNSNAKNTDKKTDEPDSPPTEELNEQSSTGYTPQKSLEVALPLPDILGKLIKSADTKASTSDIQQTGLTLNSEQVSLLYKITSHHSPLKTLTPTATPSLELRYPHTPKKLANDPSKENGHDEDEPNSPSEVALPLPDIFGNLVKSETDVLAQNNTATSADTEAAILEAISIDNASTSENDTKNNKVSAPQELSSQPLSKSNDRDPHLANDFPNSHQLFIQNYINEGAPNSHRLFIRNYINKEAYINEGTPVPTTKLLALFTVLGTIAYLTRELESVAPFWKSAGSALQTIKVRAKKLRTRFLNRKQTAKKSS